MVMNAETFVKKSAILEDILQVISRLNWDLEMQQMPNKMLRTCAIRKPVFCLGMKEMLSAFANAIGHLSYFRLLRDKSAEIQSTFLQFVVV